MENGYMYKENEKLRLLGNIGKEGDKGFVPKGTEVTFVKAIDQGLASFVVVQLDDRIFTIKEIAVEPLETNTLAVLKDFNRELIAENPELAKYHHNVFMRLFHRIKDFFKNLLTRKPKEIKIEEDLSGLKDLINDGGEIE
jgi:hypothetical protein